ncbi:MAG: hypothetical protein ACI3WQ_03125 [Faecousia sp.]
MNNRDKYKKAFSVLHASDSTDWEAIMEQNTQKKHKKTAVKLLILAAVISLMTVTASADSARLLFGWGGNMEITDHGNGVEIRVNTDELTEPVEIRDGRMYFIVNGENMDITDQVSQTKAFTYSYEDAQGVTHIWVLGLNSEELENYGYAEYLKTDTWQGGYSARVDIEADGKTNAQWLEIWKTENNCPW